MILDECYVNIERENLAVKFTFLLRKQLVRITQALIVWRVRSDGRCSYMFVKQMGVFWMGEFDWYSFNVCAVDEEETGVISERDSYRAGKQNRQ